MDITAQELHRKLESGEKFVLIDVREPWEHAEFNLGGELIPVGAVRDRLDDLSDYKADEVVLYCKSGARSGMVQAFLQAQGFKNVRNLLGGVLNWKDIYGTSKPG